MELNEKIKIFNDSVIEAAQRQGEQLVEDACIQYDQKVQQYRAKKVTLQQRMLHEQEALLKKEMNQKLSQKQMEQRKRLFDASEELKQKLFLGVERRLHQFMKSSEYETYLCDKVEHYKSYAGGNTLVVILNGADEYLKDHIAQRTGCDVHVAKQDILGGLIVEIPEKKMRIDESFLSKWKQEWDNYIF